MGVRVRILFSSQTANGTHSHRSSDAQVLLSPTAACLQASNASQLPSTTVVSFRSQPLDFVRPVSPHWAPPEGSLRFHPVLRSRKILPPRTFHSSALPIASRHHELSGQPSSPQLRANSLALHLPPFFAFLGMRALRRSLQLLSSPFRLLDLSKRSAPAASSRIALSPRFRHSSL